MGIAIDKFIKDLNLEVLVEGESSKRINVSDICRPGLPFAGHFEHFAYSRIQLIGNVEWSFLDSMDKELRKERLKEFFSYDMPCIIFARGLEPQIEFIDMAKENKVWILQCKRVTTRLVNIIINYFDRELAPRTTLHGVLMDVYGIGILLTGESGIGKSETALELIKRGHRLVADDAVDIKCIDDVLYGTSPYITSGMIEVRGLGIIDIAALYGLSSILEEKTIDLVIHLGQWNDNEDYDRLGTDDSTDEILGINLKKIHLPIRPGRNTAVIIEAAAANYRYDFVSKLSPVETINRRIDEVIKKSPRLT